MYFADLNITNQILRPYVLELSISSNMVKVWVERKLCLAGLLCLRNLRYLYESVLDMVSFIKKILEHTEYYVQVICLHLQ